MNRLHNLLSFPRIFYHALRAFRRQGGFIKKHIDPLLTEIHDEALSDADIQKIRKYYGFAVPAILGEGFCILRGKPLDHRERLSLTCLGAATGLYDDLFDKFNRSDEHILSLTTHPQEKLAKGIHEALFIKLYQKALQHTSSPETLIQRAIEVFHAQVQSKKQKGNHLSEEEIRSITLLKGGNSLLFYRSALSGRPNPAEEKMLYSLGGLMQLENDLFDIYKDYQDSIHTLATTTDQIDALRRTYKHLYHEMTELLGRTSFPKANKSYFLRYLNLIIHRGSVCLDCLEKNEKLTEGVFSINEYDRKQLICDMEKPGNLLSVFFYYVNSHMPDFN